VVERIAAWCDPLVAVVGKFWGGILGCFVGQLEAVPLLPMVEALGSYVTFQLEASKAVLELCV